MDAVNTIVGAVRLDRVWAAKLRVNFVGLTGEALPQDLESCVRGLERHIEKTVPEDKRLQCDVCGGWSNEDFSSCPFCNDEGPPPEEVFPTRRRKISSGSTNDSDEGGEDMARHHGGVQELQAMATESASTALVPTAPKVESLPIIHVEKIATPDPSPGLERLALKVTEILAAPVSKETLESAWRLAEDCDRVGGICTWSAGVLINDIHERLWQQGVEDKANFDAVVRQHTRFSPSYARRLMRLAKVTKEDVERYGASKVMTIVAAPKEEWQKLFSVAEEMSVRQLDQAVSEIKQAQHEAKVEAANAAGAEPPKKRGRPKGSGKSQKKREAEGLERALTIAVERIANPGKYPDAAAITIGLKSAKGQVDIITAEGKPCESSKSLAGSQVTIDCINGVTLAVRIVKLKSGRYVVRYEAKREVDE